MCQPDRQLIELLLAWRVGTEPFRDSARAMTSTRTVGDPASTHTVTEVAAVAQRGPEQRGPRMIPRRPLAGHLTTRRESQRRGCRPNSRRNLQIIKLTREQGLGRRRG